MKLKINNKKKSIVAWVQKSKIFEDNLLQIFQFFKEKITISKLSCFTRFYIISSENPAIILSMFSSIQELIPDVFFNYEETTEIEDLSSLSKI
ncbi:MAG: hypothetical protein ACFFD7_02855 [Candidatus Thorarchaeota archaeon]